MGIPGARTIQTRMGTVSAQSVNRYLLVARLVLASCVITCPFWLGALFFTIPQNYSDTSSLVFVPLLVLTGIFATAHFTGQNLYLRRLMFAGLAAHIAASSVFLWVGFVVYDGTVDAFHYWTVGLSRAADFQTLGWAAFPGPYRSTNLIDNICGVVALVIGDALPTLFVAFALVSLAGAYLFCRAFATSFPNGDRWLFGLLVVLLPSLLFWSSSVGKDGLIQYFIALICFGFARVVKRSGPRGALLCAIGLGGAALLRAHVALMLGIAITFSYALGRSRTRRVNIAAKVVLIPLMAGGTYLLIQNAQNFIMTELSSERSLSVFQKADTFSAYTETGGSVFNRGATLPVRIAESPFLLFRPFPWEVHNWLAVAAAVESTGWVFLCWFRRREIWWALRNWRDPYIGFLLVYTLLFIVTFGGAISNFGILLRQRIMVTPVVLMLICAKSKPLDEDNMRRSGNTARD